MTIKVDARWLEHEGGTKFYETALFVSDKGAAMLVKRYGSMDKRRRGGGVVIVQTGTAAAMRSEAASIYREKTSAKKGYGTAATSYGLHEARTDAYAEIDMLRLVRQHYGDSSKAAKDFQTYFLGETEAFATPVPVPTPAEPEPEIDRGAAWGSF